MKNRILLFAIFILIKSTAGLCTMHTVTTAGFTFSPDSISAFQGDTIVFSLSSIHSALEVSQATWQANGNTANGGFAVPFGGGMTVVTQEKTYYYVCQNHYFMGMKGRIFVQSSSGINSVSGNAPQLEVSPNPAVNNVVISTNLHGMKENGTTVAGDYGTTLRVTNMIGRNMLEKEITSSSENIDLSGFAPGIYFVEVDRQNIRIVKKLVVSR